MEVVPFFKPGYKLVSSLFTLLVACSILNPANLIGPYFGKRILPSVLTSNFFVRSEIP